MQFTASKIFTATLATLGALCLGSCSDSPNVGASLVEDESAVVIDSHFEITGRSVAVEQIQSRTITQVLGKFNAKGYGELSSEFVTQFMPATQMAADITRENIDSLKLLLMVPRDSYVGDSLAPLGLEVYRLNRMLPSPIYSDFDPTGYYDAGDPDALLASKIYACNTLNAPDSIKKLSYVPIDIKLPLSLAHELFDLYKNNPNAYVFPNEFAKYFKGIYVKNTYGSGRLIAIGSTIMRMYYHVETTDDEGNPVTKTKQGNYYAVTPEVVVNNTFRFKISDELEQRIADGQQLLVAPVGLNVDLRFPTEELLATYRGNAGTMSVINSLSMSIPADNIVNDYSIVRPTNVLLVLKSKAAEFFRNNSLPDNETSFLATYDASRSRYYFGGMRNYLLAMLQKEAITDDDCIFTIMPVSTQSETSAGSYYTASTTTITAITPYVGTPTMVRLHLDESTLTLTFSKQTL